LERHTYESGVLVTIACKSYLNNASESLRKTPKGSIQKEEVLKSVRKSRGLKKEKLAKAIPIQNLHQD